jgi:hypothetical protein
MCIVVNQHLTQNRKMKTNPISALIFATLLAGAAVAAEAQTPEIAVTPAARQSNQTEPERRSGKKVALWEGLRA